MKIEEIKKENVKLKEQIMYIKQAMMDRVVRKGYDGLLTTIEDVEEIFGNAYESEFDKYLGQTVKETAERFAERLKAKQAPLDEYDEISIGSLFSDIDEIYKEIVNKN